MKISVRFWLPTINELVGFKYAMKEELKGESLFSLCKYYILIIFYIVPIVYARSLIEKDFREEVREDLSKAKKEYFQRKYLFLKREVRAKLRNKLES